MFEDDERHGGVTYIGPRSFVAGFALLCAAFVALVYGAERLVGSADVSLPVAPVAATMVVPVPTLPPAMARVTLARQAPPPKTAIHRTLPKSSVARTARSTVAVFGTSTIVPHRLVNRAKAPALPMTIPPTRAASIERAPLRTQRTKPVTSHPARAALAPARSRRELPLPAGALLIPFKSGSLTASNNSVAPDKTSPASLLVAPVRAASQNQP